MKVGAARTGGAAAHKRGPVIPPVVAAAPRIVRLVRPHEPRAGARVAVCKPRGKAIPAGTGARSRDQARLRLGLRDAVDHHRRQRQVEALLPRGGRRQAGAAVGDARRLGGGLGRVNVLCAGPAGGKAALVPRQKVNTLVVGGAPLRRADAVANAGRGGAHVERRGAHEVAAAKGARRAGRDGGRLGKLREGIDRLQAHLRRLNRNRVGKVVARGAGVSRQVDAGRHLAQRRRGSD